LNSKFNLEIESRALSAADEALLLNSTASNKEKILSSLPASRLAGLQTHNPLSDPDLSRQETKNEDLRLC
jgi:hypothetical protein